MKKILTIFLLIMIIVSLYQITNMYALYKTEKEGEFTTQLGVWSIKVNGTDISSGEQNISIVLGEDAFKSVSTENVAEGKIAPDAEMYVDFEIDSSNTDVPVIYNFELKNDEELNADIRLSRVENYFQKSGDEIKVANTQISSNGNIHTGVIPLDKINEGYINKVRCYYIWQENNSELGNQADSELGSQEELTWSASIDVNLKQYTGESY